MGISQFGNFSSSLFILFEKGIPFPRQRPAEEPLSVTFREDTHTTLSLTLRLKMDRNPPGYRRIPKTQTKPELYSTVVVHSDSDSDREQGKPKNKQPHRYQQEEEEEEEADLYATMVYKNETVGEDEDDDDSSLPPLLKRLPKDFGGGAPIDYDDDRDGYGGANQDGDFGTMIVKTDRSGRSRSNQSSLKPRVALSPRGTGRRSRMDAGDEDDDESDGDGDEYGTFVVRSTARRERERSTMGRAVAGMQAVGELGFGGKQRRGSGSSPFSSQIKVAEHRQQQQQQPNSKISTTSIPESVTREDPCTKYELLNELGALVSSFYFCFTS